MSCKKAEDQILQNSPINKELPDWCLEHLKTCSVCNKLHTELSFVGSELDELPQVKTPAKLANDLKMEIISELNYKDKKQYMIKS